MNNEVLNSFYILSAYVKVLKSLIEDKDMKLMIENNGDELTEDELRIYRSEFLLIKDDYEKCYSKLVDILNNEFVFNGKVITREHLDDFLND